MDTLFGTFRASFAEDKDDKEKGPKARNDFKSTLRELPTLEFATYLALAFGCCFVWAQAALGVSAGTSVDATQALYLAALVGFGPVVLASVVSFVFGGVRGVEPKPMSLAGNLMHLTLGSLFCSAPVMFAAWLALMPAGFQALRP